MAARRERGAGSDLAPRIVVAIPAIVFALIIVHQGVEVWTIGIFALGVVGWFVCGWTASDVPFWQSV